MIPKRFRAILEAYRENFPLVTFDNNEKEEFKWKGVRTFQENWNPDAEDWTQMLKAAFRDVSVLNAGQFNQPVDGLIRLSQIPGETERFLKPQFEALLSSDGGDLAARMERVTSFRSALNAAIREHFPGDKGKEQTNRSILAYLSLWRPEENYFFMSSKAIAWAKYIGFNGTIGEGDLFSLPEYYRMCDEILHALQDFPQVLTMARRCREVELPDYDDKDHIIVYDILFCCEYYHLYEKANLIPVGPVMRKLLDQIQETEKEIEELDEKLEDIGEPVPLPNLMGQTVHHTRWGDGIVVNLPGPSIWVQFEDKLHKAPRDRFLRNSCVSLDVPYVELEDANNYLRLQRTGLEHDRKVLSNRLAVLMKENEYRLETL